MPCLTASINHVSAIQAALLLLALAGSTLNPTVGQAQDAAAARELTQVRQGFRDVMPTVAAKAALPYPAAAVGAATQGSAEIEVVVGTRGTVIHTRSARFSDERFRPDEDMLAAVRRWRFGAAMQEGWPVPCLVVLQIVFPASASPADVPVVSAEVAPVPQLPAAADDPRGLPSAIYDDQTAGLRFAEPLREVQPKYTPSAMRAVIQGAVTLDIVVLADGTVGEARVAKSLDKSGLDREALIAACYWLFKPATLNGRPVASRAKLVLSFKLH